MDASVELVSLSHSVAQSLMTTVNDIEKLPMQFGEDKGARSNSLTKLASGEAQFILNQRKAIKQYELEPSNETEIALISWTQTLNDRLSYLQACLHHCDEVIAFRNFVQQANDWRENVYSTHADIGLRFLSAIAPILSVKTASEKRAPTLEELVESLRRSTLETLLSDTSMNHATLAVLKAELVVHSIDKTEAVDAVESQSLPKTFQVKSFSYARNLLMGLLKDFRGTTA